MGKRLEEKDKNHFKNLADELKPREQMASLPSVTMMSSVAYDLFRRALPPDTRQEMFFVLPLDVKDCPLSLCLVAQRSPFPSAKDSWVRTWAGTNSPRPKPQIYFNNPQSHPRRVRGRNCARLNLV